MEFLLVIEKILLQVIEMDQSAVVVVLYSVLLLVLITVALKVERMVASMVFPKVDWLDSSMVVDLVASMEL